MAAEHDALARQINLVGNLTERNVFPCQKHQKAQYIVD